MGLSYLWLHACKPRPSQLIQHCGCVHWSSQGTMAFTMQAAYEKLTCFCFLLCQFGVSRKTLYSLFECHRTAKNSSPLVTNVDLLFPKLQKSNYILEPLSPVIVLVAFYPTGRTSRFSLRGGGRLQEVPRDIWQRLEWGGGWDKKGCMGWCSLIRCTHTPGMWKIKRISLSPKALQICLHQSKTHVIKTFCLQRTTVLRFLQSL